MKDKGEKILYKNKNLSIFSSLIYNQSVLRDGGLWERCKNPLKCYIHEIYVYEETSMDSFVK